MILRAFAGLLVGLLLAVGSAPVAADTWTDYNDIGTDLLAHQSTYPTLCERYDLGLSVNGRHLWALRITDNISLEEDEPEFKYIATMHGDEIVGTKMCMMLIDYLLTNYGGDPQATNIVDSVDLWIVPLMNPDGYTSGPRTRYNANLVDLNRNFPDFGDPNTTAGRAIETAHVMNWSAQHAFVASANFHGGALVVNYPFDNSLFGSQYSPDDDLFIYISEEYSSRNLPMWSGSWFHGITNGAEWYVVYGGMQDWNYLFMGCNEVTIELGNTKQPSATQIGALWNDNRDAMLAYIETSLIGVRGVVTDGTTGLPLAATVTVAGRNHEVYTDPDVGDYHRMLLAGAYDLTFDAAGYAPVVETGVVVTAGAATVLDVQLGSVPTISVTPVDDLAASGPVGGPFPGAQIYRVTSEAPNAVNVEVTASASWIALNGSAGPVAFALSGVGDYEDVTVDIASAADALVAGTYNGAVDFTNLSGGEGDATRSVTLDVGSSVYAPADTPPAILDNNTTTSTLTVPDAVCIGDVDVDMDITHTYIGDLIVELSSPGGVTVRLHNRSGGSANDIVTTYDEQGSTVPDGPGSLADFNLTGAAGVWTLTVSDEAGGDTGTLNDWALKVVPLSGECPTPELVYSFPFDSHPGWTAQGEWEFGSPGGGNGDHGQPDPTSAHSGLNVYGYDLAALPGGGYADSLAETHLTSTAIDCTGLTNVQLRFWRWLGVEKSSYDHAYVRVSSDLTNWTTIWENPNQDISDATWLQQQYDISGVADDEPTVYVRWTMGTTDTAYTFCGWNIDDVEVWAVQETSCATGPGDMDGDGDVDGDDIQQFTACYVADDFGSAECVCGGGMTVADFVNHLLAGTTYP